MATITGTNKIDILVGTAGADILDGLKDKDAMFGGLGNDVYFVENTGDRVYENAGEGIDLVKSTVTFVLSDNVENLTLLGAGAIDAYGNGLNNVLTGNDGNNFLVGGDGNDTMIGGKGSDTYFVDRAGDKVIESVSNANGGGTDTVFSSIDFSLAKLANVENLILTAGAYNGTGNALANTITGNDTSNRIDGGAGADVLIGGNGHDVYTIDNVGDVVQEKSNEGIDWVVSKVALTNSIANVENYQFDVNVGVTFSGSADNNIIVGGSANDTIDGGGMGNDNLSGRGGDDTLTGGSGVDNFDGGTGADIMKGLAGADYYIVDNLKDQVIEQGGQGTDTVWTSISLGKLFDNVENIILGYGKSNLNATGNDLDNEILGNDGNNVIDGGKGADHMVGGNGNDTYIVDTKLDQIDESASTGIDLVKSSVTYALGTNIENLTLTGTGDINATGNGDKNILIGNSGANTLDGRGGDDTMTGGAGNDLYIVDSKGDKVIEAANGGTQDTVWSAIDFSLAALANVEQLYLSGTTAIHATGNAQNNYIEGNDAANDIDGGKGADFMHGGKGNDTYHIDNLNDFAHEMSGEGYDRVISTVALGAAYDNVESYEFVTSQAVKFVASANDDRVIGGSAADDITGGGGMDQLYGGAGNDLIHGNAGSDFIDGGTGGDTMYGDDGDDTYIVDNVKDIVSEKSNEGTDEVNTSISLEWLFGEVENLYLMGSGNLNGGGNASANMIFGNNGNNVLSGRDGNDTLVGNGGDDTLNGGAGADTFVFNLSAMGQGHDKVSDFVKAEDVLWFTSVDDANNDGNVDLNDLLANVSAVVDHGAGQAVDVAFNNGSIVSFAGCGTGAANSVDDLVANSATQIQIN
jgi:Ca2+-binding RTX toxin-like protein